VHPRTHARVSAPTVAEFVALERRESTRGILNSASAQLRHSRRISRETEVTGSSLSVFFIPDSKKGAETSSVFRVFRAGGISNL